MLRRHASGLTPRLAAALLLAALTPTLALGASSAWRVRAQAREETIRGSLDLVRAVGFGIDANVQDARRALEAAAALPDIADAPWDAAHAPDLQRRLELLAGRLPLLTAITPLDPAGAPLLPHPEAPAFTPELADNYGGYVSDVTFDPKRGASQIYIVVEVRDQRLTKRGFLAGAIDLTALQTALTEALAPRGEPPPHLLLIDSQGRPLYPPPAAPPASLRPHHPAADRVLATLEEGHLTWTDPQGTEWLVVYKSMLGYSRFRGIRWGLLLQRPTQDAFAAANQAALHTVLAAILAAILAVPLAGALARWLTRDLQRLGAYARDIGRAPAAPPSLPLDLLQRPDEIGALACALDAMRLDLLSAQEDRQRQHHALRRAERLSSVGLLAAGVAHEINNPLTTIVGYAALLLEDLPDDHPDREALSLITDEADRVRHIVRGLLDLSRRPSAHAPVDLRDTLRRAVTLASAGLDLTDVTLQIDAPDQPLTLHADPQALLQLLMNLIGNAADAIHEAQRPGTITLQVTLHPDRLDLAVLDDGPGFPPDVLPHAAEPFFTTKPPGKGTGLGLAVVASLAFDHDATLHLDSPPGGGACVRLEFKRGTPPGAVTSSPAGLDDRPRHPPVTATPPGP